ncbi:MAG TPA: hypothetical protein VFN31_02610 [Candidatus Saccharimonadales bacterium]|nr:hypothetical protein [Candidatus Saccharimonadales bacterium]
MEKERMQSVNEIKFNMDYAEGSVDPSVRVKNGEISQDNIDQMENEIINNQYTQYVDKGLSVCHCMDCRRTSDNQAVIGVKAAGGSLTAVIADSLTLGKYRKPGESVAGHTRTVLQELVKRHQSIGGHTATNLASPAMSGCGAADKLDNLDPSHEHPSILDFFIRNADRIFEDLGSLNDKANLGLNLTDKLEAGMVERAQNLRAENYATTGKEISEVMTEIAGPENMDELSGPQKAVLAVVMMSPGEVLDMAKIHDKYDDDYEVFEISGWGVANTIRALSLDPEDYNDMLVAALAYNLSAAGVIGGPGLKIIVKN